MKNLWNFEDPAYVLTSKNYYGEAAKNGYDSSGISKCCRHIRQTYKGYKWEYLNN